MRKYQRKSPGFFRMTVASTAFDQRMTSMIGSQADFKTITTFPDRTCTAWQSDHRHGVPLQLAAVDAQLPGEGGLPQPNGAAGGSRGVGKEALGQ